MRLKKLGLSIMLVTAMSGCATTHEPSDRLVALQTEYQALVQKGAVNEYAPVALKQAEEAIDKAANLEKKGADKSMIEQQEYIARRKLDTAVEKAKYAQAEEKIENSDVRRTEIQLQAKELQAERAQAQAEAMRVKAAMAEDRAATAEQKADEMATRAEKLTATLEHISAKNSERGLVITMDDILFDVGKSDLKSGTQRSLARVAEFLNQYPGREVLVEGFTDSTGSDQFNQGLSERRARAVADMLVTEGISQGRIETRGYGEQFPVTSNDTKAGRQQNRRVEMIIAHSDETPVTERR